MRGTSSQTEPDELHIRHLGRAAHGWIVESELGPDGAFFQQISEQSGDPALDVGCDGGGRNETGSPASPHGGL